MGNFTIKNPTSAIKIYSRVVPNAFLDLFQPIDNNNRFVSLSEIENSAVFLDILSMAISLWFLFSRISWLESNFNS